MTYLLFGVLRGVRRGGDSGVLSREDPLRGDLWREDRSRGGGLRYEDLGFGDLSRGGDLEREVLARGDLSLDPPLDLPLDLPPDRDRYVAWL